MNGSVLRVSSNNKSQLYPITADERAYCTGARAAFRPENRAFLPYLFNGADVEIGGRLTRLSRMLKRIDAVTTAL